MAEQRQPWTHKGVKLGFIRGSVYWIDITVHGARYRLSTGCRTPEAAFAEYQRFEREGPERYKPRLREVDPENWEALTVAYLAYSKNIKDTSERHRDDVVRRLANWGRFPGFTSPSSFTAADIEAFVAALRAGEVTSRARKNNLTGEIEKVATSPGLPTVNRHLAALKGFMRWCRRKN